MDGRRDVYKRQECVDHVCRLAEMHGVEKVVIGDRTGSAEIVSALMEEG